MARLSRWLCLFEAMKAYKETFLVCFVMFVQCHLLCPQKGDGSMAAFKSVRAVG